jgi:hypothetical protein
MACIPHVDALSGPFTRVRRFYITSLRHGPYFSMAYLDYPVFWR